jgi:hypothetical protein
MYVCGNALCLSVCGKPNVCMSVEMPKVCMFVRTPNVCISVGTPNDLLVQLVVTSKITIVKANTYVDLAHLPFQPACLVLVLDFVPPISTLV